MTIILNELASGSVDFPPTSAALAEPNGLLAYGGDLTPHRLLNAYANGIFPWYGPNEPILWWSPSPRAVFYPDQFAPSRSLRKFQRRARYQVTLNFATPKVIDLCAATRSAEETWLNSEMRHAYKQLIPLGACHSVEVWDGNQLIGGLYGILSGQLFCGESMFSLASNASKIALWYFCDHFAKQGGKLIDCQVMNPHLASLGAITLERDDFLAQLNTLKNRPLAVNTMTPQPIQIERLARL
ncbi:leucyl/phenylalanyl-tRNA--protein transferase [Vibrio sp. SM6]|uniref:Leucyl/phenylalanyl-tRNA--protein transferase n=1 Tax=Vibrio agarilyticus TaxID=2726741 RepID=A0A7X8TMI8_9VIBR|nr:leucyl/phenylalanyl-tRNA--protein transferase [Vibrio agarilyticus]NLS11310.1 leucyl/phenylalanyl-tRNA--protein transferase [Vibrio agarilyticus]